MFIIGQVELLPAQRDWVGGGLQLDAAHPT